MEAPRGGRSDIDYGEADTCRWNCLIPPDEIETVIGNNVHAFVDIEDDCARASYEYCDCGGNDVAATKVRRRARG